MQFVVVEGVLGVVRIAAVARAGVADESVPDAGGRINELEFAARRAVDEKIVVLVNREVGIEARAFLDQAALEQGRGRVRAVLVVQLHGIAREADAAHRLAVLVVHARARIDDARRRRARRGQQRCDMRRQQLVVVVEKVEPCSACRVEAGIGGVGARQVAVGMRKDQTQLATFPGFRQRAMAAAAGGDDDEFDIGPGLRRGGIERAFQGRPVHAADQDRNQRWIVVRCLRWRRVGHRRHRLRCDGGERLRRCGIAGAQMENLLETGSRGDTIPALQILAARGPHGLGVAEPVPEGRIPFAAEAKHVLRSQRCIGIRAETAAGIAGLCMPQAGGLVDVAERGARRAADLEIVILVHRERRIETYAFVDQAALEQQCAGRGAAVEIQLHMVAGVTDMAQRAALRVDDARAREHDALVLRARRGKQGGEMLRQQFVVVVEEVEPFAARRLQRNVGRIRPRQAPLGLRADQAQRAALPCVGQRPMCGAVGRDDDNFEVRPGLRRGGIQRACQRRPIHAADQDRDQRWSRDRHATTSWRGDTDSPPRAAIARPGARQWRSLRRCLRRGSHAKN